MIPVLITLAAAVCICFAGRWLCRVIKVLQEEGRNFDAWGNRINREGLHTFVRINHAPGVVAPIYCLLLGRDRLGQRVCGWWDKAGQRVLYIRPRGGRWLKRSAPPRSLTEGDLEAMRRSATRHAEWANRFGRMGDPDPRIVGALPSLLSRPTKPAR